MSLRYHAACCQTAFPCPKKRSEIPARIDHMVQMMHHAVGGYEPFFDVRLLVFPEFAHAAPTMSLADLREKLAVELPGDSLTPYIKTCQELGCFVWTGTFLERDSNYPDAVFNTTCLVGPTGLLAKYRKVNPWVPWEVHASPHDIADYPDDPFPVVETEIGRLGAAICYDWLFPETLRELAFKGAEVLVRVSAYMDPWGATPPMDWWTLFNRARAAENTACVVACNQGASLAGYPPFSWPGGSMIVDHDGRIMSQADPGEGEKIVVGPVDVSAVRDARSRRRGHDMRSHLRRSMHGLPPGPGLSPATEHPITSESLEARLSRAKGQLPDQQ